MANLKGGTTIAGYEALHTGNSTTALTTLGSFLRSDVADTKTAGTLRFDNGVLATWGSLDNAALDISHDGSNALIENNVGLINIKSDVGTQFDSRIILDAPNDGLMTIKWEINDDNRYVIGSQLGILTTGTTNDIIHYTYGGSSASWGVYTNTLRRLTVDGNGRTAIGSITAPASQLHIYESSTTTGAETGVTIEQDGTGDALLHFKLTSVEDWTMGIDNDYSGSFAIESSTGLGFKAALRIHPTTKVLEGIDGLEKSIVETTGTTYTIEPINSSRVQYFTNGGSITVTVNSGSLDYVGQTAELDHFGSGTLTVAAGTATLLVNANDTLVADGQYSRIAVQKMSTTEYRVFGQLTPA